MRGRSNAERLERAIREPHNRVRRPMKTLQIARAFVGCAGRIQEIACSD